MATIEARSYIKVLLKKGLSIKEIKAKCDEAFDTDSPSESAIKRWCHEFKCGREDVLNRPIPGRPQEVGYDALMAPVSRMLAENKRISIRDIAKATKESVRTIHTVVTDHLGFRKLTPDAIPHSLSHQQKQQRVTAAEVCLILYNKNPSAFFECLITIDETWVSVYDPLSRTESKEWEVDRQDLSRRPTSDRRDPKAMASVFWDSKGIIEIFWTEQGGTVDGD